MPIPLSGSSSVADRTLFTRRGPIVKPALPILTGFDLVIESPNRVKITSANFVSDDVGKVLSISGSLNKRNDGEFVISRVMNSITVELRGANFNTVDEVKMFEKLVVMSGQLKTAFNRHRTHQDDRIEYPSTTHLNNDNVNEIVSSDAHDIASLSLLLNEIRAKFLDHMSNSNGKFHSNEDRWNSVLCLDSNSLSSAMQLANELRERYESHRIERRSHFIGDAENRVASTQIEIISQSIPGSLIGPFQWVLSDPRIGMVADSPDDVRVQVNGVNVEVQAVFGRIGAVILKSRPLPSDEVHIDYDYINNPPSGFLRLNSPEFVLNQDKNGGVAGLPSHRYRARSYLIDPAKPTGMVSATTPLEKQWKYKAFERAYSSTSNDPEKLLLNSPTNKIKYPVLRTSVQEATVSYDSVALPQNYQDPWTFEGEGDCFLSEGLLTIVDGDVQNTLRSKPPFFTHEFDIVTDSIVSAAFRAKVNEFQPDGVFTGVCFGVSDGSNVILVGFIETEATNLSSAIVLANTIKSKFNLHIMQPMVHGRDGLDDLVEIVDARNLDGLVILANAIKLKFNCHVDKADPTMVTVDSHKIADHVNKIFHDDAKDLESAISLVNEIRIKVDSHRTQNGVHFSDDVWNDVPLAMQVGILTNSGAYEFQESWASGAADWTILSTYRIHRDPDGSASLYMSGDTEPIASVQKSSLPSISDFGGKFDLAQQTFFGSISREATSSSSWNLVRANINPVNSRLIESNKSVVYESNNLPEHDLINPWITLGHGGYGKILHGNTGLLVDSTCSASSDDAVSMGESSGAFKGYMRMEPILAPSSSCTVDFESSIDFHTAGLGSRPNGVFIDDGQLSVHFAFLYYSPSPAHVVGSSSTFSISPSDDIEIGLNGSRPIKIIFSSFLSNAVDVAAEINSAMGFEVASDDGFNHIKLSYGSGSSSYISIVGGLASTKLGIAVGKYFGKDSNPEPRVSWFSEAPPDLVDIPWTKYGDVGTQMIGAAGSPAMRIEDNVDDSYAAFSMSNPIVVSGSMDPSSDWKMDARLTVIEFQVGQVVPAAHPLDNLLFAGVLINVDEGYGGKNVELHCAVDSSGSPYLNLVTYDSSLNSISPVAQYVFDWNDGKTHSFSVYTNKSADQMFVCADGEMLASTGVIPTYSSLSSAASPNPSISFGSGSDAASNVDLRSSKSVVDWESVAVFRDSKISDPSAPNNRYVGVYKGGDPSKLESWYISNVDWSLPHSYRISINPSSCVSVHLDGVDTPILSIGYNSISLPPVSSSFLQKISNGRPLIAWGAFNPKEISRTRWKRLSYSAGKTAIKDRVVPPKQSLNQANAMASPDCFGTGNEHSHFGFSTYSGGTPLDDFMSNWQVQAYTVLGENVPPVPKTQNLESRGGLVRRALPAMDVSAEDFVNSDGFLGKFEDDMWNEVLTNDATGPLEALSLVVQAANILASAYEGHRTRYEPAASVHFADDMSNIISTPAASDLQTAIDRLADFKNVFNSHIGDVSFHLPEDSENEIVSADPTDLESAIEIVNEASAKYANHVSKGQLHVIPSSPPYFDLGLVTAPYATDDATCSDLLDDIKQKAFVGTHPNLAHVMSSRWHSKTANYSISLGHSVSVALANQMKSILNLHMEADGVHRLVDSNNKILSNDAIDLNSAISLANDIRDRYNAHIGGQIIHQVDGMYDFVYVNKIPTPLESAIDLANDIMEKFSAHASDLRSHVEPYPVSGLFLANNESSMIDLANKLKTEFNGHLSGLYRESSVHVRDDFANGVASPDAFDMESACSILNELKLKFNLHRTQAGVHGSSAFIRLDPPSGVLYEGMKFWTQESGKEHLVSSFSDDDGWYIDAIKNQSDKTLLYDGKSLPSQAFLVSVGAKPGLIEIGDTMVIEVDRDPPFEVVFQSGDDTLSAVIDRINQYMPGLASEYGGEVRLESPQLGNSSSVIVNGGTALEKLGLTIPHHSPWFVVSENPSDVSISMMSEFGEEFLRYGVSGASKTVYANRVVYPDMPSTGFVMSVRVRVNYDHGYEDSGAYVGLAGSANAFGYAIAIGWGRDLSGRFVKVQDMANGKILDKIHLNWLDGNFHTYDLEYAEKTQMFKLTVDP